MTAALLYLFDDGVARRWAPFTLTRPAGELTFGCLSARARAERVFGIPCAGHLTRRGLAGFDEPGSPPVVQPGDLPTDAPRILLSSRVVPDFDQDVEAALQAGDVRRLTLEGTTVGWILPPSAPLPEAAALRDPASRTEGAAAPLRGTFLDGPWDLVAETPERISADVARLFEPSPWPDGVVRIGDGVLSLAPTATVEPGVVVDTRDGPVRLEDGVRVEGPARLVGPLWLGAGTLVFGGHVGSSSIGPVCKVRGEIAGSVLLGWDNKAHDGHLGHALLGRWVNLGAGTTNSDLKNNYGTVRVWTPDGEVDTGRIKVGCLLGDHVKTGIGTPLNTGCVVGAGSNVFGGAMPPTVVPPFSWGSGTELGTYRLDKFIEVAQAAMARRRQELSPGVRAILERAWRATRGSSTS